MKRLLLFIVTISATLLIPASAMAHGEPVHSGPKIRLKNGLSTNWSGFAAETNLNNPQNGAVSDVKGQWTIPSLSCTNTSTYSSAWVGIDGYSDNSVEQTGTEHDCRSGRVTYYAWYEMYPKYPAQLAMRIHAGDTMSAEVQYIGSNMFSLTIKNVTTGSSFNTVQRARASRQSAEWIVEAPWSGGVLPLAIFGNITFSNSSATINNHSGGINDASWQNDSINMVNSNGTVKAATLPVSTDGSSFTVNWQHS